MFRLSISFRLLKNNQSNIYHLLIVWQHHRRYTHGIFEQCTPPECNNHLPSIYYTSIQNTHDYIILFLLAIHTTIPPHLALLPTFALILITITFSKKHKVCTSKTGLLMGGGQLGNFVLGPSLKGSPGGPLSTCFNNQYTLIEQSGSRYSNRAVRIQIL